MRLVQRKDAFTLLIARLRRGVSFINQLFHFRIFPSFGHILRFSDDPNPAVSGVGIGIGLGLARHTERPTLQGRSGFFET